jgi:hypothetical protein
MRLLNALHVSHMPIHGLFISLAVCLLCDATRHHFALSKYIAQFCDNIGVLCILLA